jgi:transcriptional regulator GlxA family with amidase domain
MNLDRASADESIAHFEPSETKACADVVVARDMSMYETLARELSVVAAQIIEAACRAREGDGEATRAHITHAARLLRECSDSGGSAVTAASARSIDHIRLHRVLDYIAANIENKITLSDLAGIAGRSPFHFAHTFTIAMNISPQRYVRRMRLEKAMAQLAAGKLPLVEIALNAHFSSQASFTRAFHRTIGMTPREYQRRRDSSKLQR